MLKHALLGPICVLFLFSSSSLVAQVVCPLNGTLSPKLICMIPQVFGPVGLGGGGPQAPLLENNHMAGFESDFATSTLAPINQAIGVQVSQLPLASPSSAITWAYNPAAKIFTASTEESLGPIIGERATTIGRRRLFVAFSYQYFGFSTIDGSNLHSLPIIFEHQVFPADSMNPPCPNQTGLKPQYQGDPCFVRAFISTTNSIDMKAHQFAFYATYGITSNLDVSIVVPILDVRMAVKTSATIVNNSVPPPGSQFPAFHLFNPGVVKGCANTPPSGVCLDGSFSDSGSASGVGDIVLRGKYNVYKGEKAALAAGVDVRVPSGDVQNFLGSGTTGVRPFGVFSYEARVTPHAEVGYEVNGNSILAGDFAGLMATGAKGSLPNRFVYILGADASIMRRLSASFDFYGQRFLSAAKLVATPYTDQGSCSDSNCTTLTPGTTHPNVTQTTGDIDIRSLAFGVKYRPTSNLVVTGNVLVKVDDGGLRSRAVPLVGVSYSF